jgi:cytochrome P450
VIESGRSVHSLAPAFLAVVEEEVHRLLAQAGDELDWAKFTSAWHRLVRRVVLGDGARDDHDLTDMLAKLRAAANWAFLHPRRKRLLRDFQHRVAAHLARAERGSLAERIAAVSKSDATAPPDQVAHYLFAFDAAGMATFRALALLASHPRQAQRAREEIARAGSNGREDLPFVRACVLDGLRLWPTTPAILRETTEDVRWHGGVMPERTSILIFVPYFHRDDESLPYADRFAPELWLDERPGSGWPLVPFSGGPGICPARDLVPMIASATIAAVLASHRIGLEPPTRLDPDEPLPGTLDNFSLRFSLQPQPGGASV